MSLNILKKSEIRALFPHRNPLSHKGQNGRVLIIGGSLDYFGAPILAALGALCAGADLVTLLVPECNFEVSRSFYPDFIVRKYPGNYVNSRTLDAAVELLPKMDCVLIGPGVSEDPESLRVITRILEKCECPAVLDAEAIPAIAQLGLPRIVPSAPVILSEAKDPLIPAPHITITPNRAEMVEICERTARARRPSEDLASPGRAQAELIQKDPEETAKVVEDFVHKWGVTILLKGQHDIIVSPNQPTRFNETGNAGMTVGGSGDVLAGAVASLIAQHISDYDASLCAAFLVGASGDSLFRHKGYNFTATDIALELPYTIKGIIA